MDIGSTISSGLFIVIGVAAIAFILFLMEKAKYNIHVTIRDLSGEKCLIYYDKGKEYVDKNNVMHVKLQKKKWEIPDLPYSCIDIDSKGKKYVELVRHADLTYSFVRFDLNKYTSNMVDEKGKPIKMYDNHSGVSQGSRISYANQFIKGLEKKTQGSLLKSLEKYMPVIMIAIVVIGAWLMFTAVGDSQVKVANANKEASEKMAAAMDNLTNAMIRYGYIVSNTTIIDANTIGDKRAPN